MIDIIVSLLPAYSYLETQCQYYGVDEPEFIGAILAQITTTILDLSLEWTQQNEIESIYHQLAQTCAISQEESASICRHVDNLVASLIILQLPDFGSKHYRGLVNHRFINTHDVRISITTRPQLTLSTKAP